jgi:hypothetical protein
LHVTQPKRIEPKPKHRVGAGLEAYSGRERQLYLSRFAGTTTGDAAGSPRDRHSASRHCELLLRRFPCSQAKSQGSTCEKCEPCGHRKIKHASRSQIPVDGTYVSDILPGLLTVSIGLGGVFTGLTTAANAGVSEDKAGLAAGLLNTGQQLGAALGLAILSALATARTSSLMHAGHDTVAQATTHGYQRALMAGSVLMLAASVVALLARNTRQTTAPVVEEEPALDLAA